MSPTCTQPCLIQGSSIPCYGVGDVSKGPQDESLILALASLEDARSWGWVGEGLVGRSWMLTGCAPCFFLCFLAAPGEQRVSCTFSSAPCH